MNKKQRKFLNGEYSRVIRITVFAILAVILVFGSFLLNNGGNFNKALAGVSLSQIGLFSAVLVVITVTLLSEATKIGIEDESRANEGLRLLEQENIAKYNSLDIQKAIVELNKYNKEQIEVEQKLRNETYVRKLKIKQTNYKIGSKKYKKYENKINIAVNKIYKFYFKPIKITGLQLTCVVTSAYTIDSNSVSYETKKARKNKNLISNITSKIIFGIIGGLSYGILLEGDILAACVFTVTYALLMIFQYMNEYVGTRQSHKTRYIQALKDKIKILDIISPEDTEMKPTHGGDIGLLAKCDIINEEVKKWEKYK